MRSFVKTARLDDLTSISEFQKFCFGLVETKTHYDFSQKVISEQKSRAMNPDYYLVLPWHFKAEFLEREKEAIDKGTGFIFPLPEIEIIKR